MTADQRLTTRSARPSRLVAAARRGRWAVAAIAAGVVLAGITIAAVDVASGPLPKYYVAIGASQTLGFQPSASDGQQATDQGYTNDLLAIEKARWPELQLVTFACPGIRVDMALVGRTTNRPGSMAAETASGRCRRSTGSEVGTASAFIGSHPGQVVLVTVDLGFPDITVCLKHAAIDSACVTDALARVRSDLPRVVSRLRMAGGSSLRIVGLDYEDPFLGYYVGQSGSDSSFAEASLQVVDRLDRVVSAAYKSAGARLAQVSDAFDTNVIAPSSLRGRGTVPLDVKRICTLTWMCIDRNPHPNAKGYRAIASAVAAALRSGGR